MRRGRLAVLLGVVLGASLCMSTAEPAAARTLVVAKVIDAGTPGCDASTPYTTIGSAVAAARPHDVVLVCPGTYAEQLVISTPLALRGVSGAVVKPQGMVANTTSLTSTNALATVIVVDGVAGVTIEGLTIDGADNAITACPAGVPTPDLFGVFFRNASGAIRDSAIRNMRLGPGLEACGGGTGILVQSASGGRSVVTIEGTSIHAFQRNGITANEVGTDVRIRRNVVTGLGPTTGAVQNGIQVARGATGLVAENVVTETISANCTAASCPLNANNILLGSGSSGVEVTRNVLGRGQTGVAVFGNANRVQDNVIFHTLVFDGIYVDGHDNDIHGNDVTRSDESGIFTAGSRNRVSRNRINEAAVGLLNDGVDNTFLHNTILNTPVPGPIAP
jgi:parallel beta-helix repeat protein